MAQILIIIGSLLVGGSGIYQLIQKTPYKNKKTGQEMSMKATIAISVACICVGAIGLVYAISMG